MKPRFPFAILSPSVGDQVLRHARTATIEITRSPNEVEVTFSLGGTFPADGNGAKILAGLASLMTRPLTAREREEGDQS